MPNETQNDKQSALKAWRMLLGLSLIAGTFLILLFLTGCSTLKTEVIPEADRPIDDLLITVEPIPDWENYPHTIGGLWLYMEDLEDWGCDTLTRYDQLVTHASKGKQELNTKCKDE